MVLTKDYVSNKFRSMPANSGHLAIHITEEQCTIAISSEEKTLVFLRNITKDSHTHVHTFIKEVFSEHQILFTKGFKQTSIGISTTMFTIVPNSFEFEPKEIMDFISGSPTRKSFSEDLPSLNSKLIYSLPQPLLNVIEQSFQYYNIVPTIKLGIEKIKSQNADTVLIFENNYFDCFTYNNNKLHSVNRHPYVTAEDVAYFVGLALNDADIDPKEAKVLASGSVKMHSPVFNTLYKYFQNVEIRTIDTEISVRTDFETPQQNFQYVLNLLNANY